MHTHVAERNTALQERAPLEEDPSRTNTKQVLLAMGFHDRGFRRGALSYAKKAGWCLSSETSIMPVVPRTQNWDGIVAAPTPYAHALNEYLDNIQNVPIVWADPEDFDIEKVCVLADHRAMGHLMAEYLIDQGLPTIAYYGGYKGFHDSDERRGGVMEACNIMGIPFHDLDICGDPSKPLDKRLKASLESLPKPLGICVVNDLNADLIVRAVLRIGLDVPEDVSIIGAENDADLCDLCRVGLTSIDGNTFHQADKACEILDRWMESGVPPSPRQLVIPPGDVVARESTGFPRSNNEEIQKALAVIEAQFKDPMLTVNSVIEPLAYKKSAVYKLFQKECGITISKFIAKRRIRHARLMLVSTELNLDQVARSAGFSTSRQFLESFRRDIGMSPTEYRTKRASAPLAHSA